MANVKATNAEINFYGISGASNIVNMWMQHFEGIYNKLDDM